VRWRISSAPQSWTRPRGRHFYASRLLLDQGNQREALRRIEAGLRFDPSATDARQMRDQLRAQLSRQP
jgi:hypothetical protein